MKRRKPLQRRTGLTSRKKLNRDKAVKRKNARRSAKEFRRAYGSQERARAVQAMSCVVCGALPSQNAHARGRGAGGGAEDIVPLCMAHHREQHDVGIATFEERYSIDLQKEARRTNAWWEEHQQQGET